MAKRELEALIVLAGKVDPSLQKAMRNAEKSTKSLNSGAALFGKAMSKGWDIAVSAAKWGTVGIGAAMTAVGAKGIMLASDLAEVQNVVDVTFGSGASQINTWSKTALKAYGLSELAAKKYTGTLGAMLKSSGIASKNLVPMSENLTALAGDFASFYNLNPDEAFQKIQSGISGEVEPLRALGIDMSVASIQAYALSKGINTSWNNMDQATKTMLRYNYLLDKSKDAQGDFTRTQTSFANQLRLLKTNFQQNAAVIMSKTLPAFSKLFEKGNQLMDSFANDPQKIQKVSDAISGGINKVINFLPKAIALSQKLWDAAVKLKWVIASVVGMIVLWHAAVKTMEVIQTTIQLVRGLSAALSFLRIAKIKDAAATLYLQSLYVKDAIIKGASTAATWTMAAANKAVRIGTLAAAAAQWVLNSAVLANPMTWIIVGVVAAIGVLVAGIYLLWKHWDRVSSFMVGIWKTNVVPFFQSIGNWFSGIWTGITNGFQAAWSGIASWFTNLWDGIVGIFKGYVNFWISALNFLIGALNEFNIKIPKWVPKIGGKEFGINIPLIPTFAKGGFANQPSIFGEAGPEAAIPLKRTPRSLGLLNQTARAIGAEPAGSAQFVFSPVINGGSSQEIESTLRGLAGDMFAQFEAWYASKRRESFA